MDLMELLQDQLSGGLMDQLTNQVGAEKEQTMAATTGAISALLNGLSKNVSQPEGAQGLLSALERDHDGSILDNLSGFLGGSVQPQNANMLNGAGILGHILGGSQNSVVDTIAKMSGLDKSKTGQLLITLAPVLLGMLGKLKNQENVGGGGLIDLITKTQQNHNQQSAAGGIFQRLLDRDGDGEIMDDLLSMGSQSLLGGLFKK